MTFRLRDLSGEEQIFALLRICDWKSGDFRKDFAEVGERLLELASSLGMSASEAKLWATRILEYFVLSAIGRAIQDGRLPADLGKL